MLLQLKNASARPQHTTKLNLVCSVAEASTRVLSLQRCPSKLRHFASLTNHTYSTTTQAEHQLPPPVEPPSLPTKPLLILDEKDDRIFKDSGNFQASRTLALIHASLKLGNIERANSLLFNFKRHHPLLYKEFIDINVRNAFLEAYLDAKPTPQLRKALEYYNSFEDFGVKANLTTFAMLIKGHVRTERLFLMQLFYQEIHLSDEDLEIFLKGINEPGETVSSSSLLLPREIMPENEQLPKREPANGGAEPADSGLLATKVAGLALLKQTLQATQSDHMDLYQKQLKLEELAIDSAVEKMRMEAEERGDKLLKMNLSPLRKAMIEWKSKLVETIAQEQRRLGMEGEDSELIQLYGRFFCLLSPEKMALITIQELLRNYIANENFCGAPVGRAVVAIGSSIEREYHAEQMREKTNRYLLKHHDNISQLYSSGKLFSMTLRKIQAQFERERINSDWIPKWPTTAHVRVGSAALGLLIDSATILVPGQKEATPAFSHSHVLSKGLRLGIVMFDPYIAEQLRNDPTPSAFGPRFLPMLVIPRPWLTYNSGGFLTSRLKAMRCKGMYEQVVYLKRADEMGMLTDVLKALDVLGSVQWRINNPVLDIVKQVWNTGKEFAGIPPAHSVKKSIPKPDNYAISIVARRDYQRKVRAQEINIRNHHSLRCDVNYKVEIAHAFRDHTFYFPHNLDFRGRAYPIPPLFNHLGNDLCRGLLVFGVARPLGARGFMWLKVHLANLYGFDKYSFAEREQFTISHLEDIMDSSDNPLGGRRWWLQAEDPWQCLAACQQLTAAVRSGNPEAYPCALPIHQDGTCNGLQHYAALGGDIEGARHVNLMRSDTPQDIYSGVLHHVNLRIDADAAAECPEAMALKGRITRKVIKQTVMTTVYGVTFIGARAQIMSQLNEISDFAGTEVGGLGLYLTRQVFASLGEIFASAQAIQAWLNECAGRISSSVPADIVHSATSIKKPTKKSSTDAQVIRSKQMTSVVWTTPWTVAIRDYDVATPVNSRKQRSAFPPNFVHSLDASHMMKTALAMQKENLYFASVHDSYWTHACDVDTMNRLIRQEFISLHSKPILDSLLQEFQTRYKGYKLHITKEKKVAQPVEPPVASILAADMLLEEDENEFTNDPGELADGSFPPKEASEVGSTKKKGSKSAAWIDLEFPPLPPRGEFDLSQVAESEYFFH
ncbi:DNA-directed RNA polymerase [Massospora cicadina]|nr:DNA-directed RNA polymerase [Massospora cicadina]